MSQPSPARYRTTNWPSYSNALQQQRGALLVWLDKEMTWLAPPDGRRHWRSRSLVGVPTAH